MLFKKQKNQLVELIRAAKFHPSLFESHDNEDEFIISIRNSPFMFAIANDLNYSDKPYFNCSCTKFFPKYPVQKIFVDGFDFLNISEVYSEFAKWLEADAREYVDEQTIPDLWAELQLPSGSSTNAEDIQNTLFSVDEQKRIVESLNQFEEEVLEKTNLSEDQFNILHERIDYLVEASQRLGRKDWLAATAGAIIGFTFQVGLTAETATQIIQMVGEAVRWIAHTPLLLP